MITGGTGSFGNAVLNRFLRTDIGEIRMNVEETKAKIASLEYIQNELNGIANLAK